jgi:hypothetical protein
MVDFGDFLMVVGAGVLIVGAIFLFALLGTIIGLFVGWVVGISPLGPFVTDGLNSFGFHTTGLLAQIGAAIGFISGIFGGSRYTKSKTEA